METGKSRTGRTCREVARGNRKKRGIREALLSFCSEYLDAWGQAEKGRHGSHAGVDFVSEESGTH